MADATLPTVERWLPVPGWPGYEVSDLGRVRSLDRVVQVGRHTQRVRGRVLTPSLDENGRRGVSLSQDGRARSFRVYRLVMEAFVGPRPPGTEICHGDNNKTNDALLNLRYDTRSENELDKVRHGVNPQVNKSRCPRGHRLIAPNLVASVARKGYRTCLVCARARSACQVARVRHGIELDFLAEAHTRYRDLMGEEAYQLAVRQRAGAVLPGVR